jgi:threonine dehydrogenase-like Zn-dependent dehydrogenase
MTDHPETQHAVQLVGPDELAFNDSKPVPKPGPHQILCRVEVVGLCFSDLKLLKQFSSHVRKSEIVTGIDTEILKGVPSYVPGKAPTVPGHEVVVRVVEAGAEVQKFEAGERYVVQADYRWLKTQDSNAAFGYNFEGALQQFVLMDERVITSPEGESMLIPAREDLSASAIALVEPWACVEDAYACFERQALKQDGQMLVVADTEVQLDAMDNLFDVYGRPAKITAVSKNRAFQGMDMPVTEAKDITSLDDAAFDDVIYFGSDARTVEKLFDKVALHGLFNIVLCGGRFGGKVAAQVGRVHYGGIRIIGTKGSDPAESMKSIPPTGELRPGDNVNVIGAGGPMGVMHVIRNICLGMERTSICATDVDDHRLDALSEIAGPLAKKAGVTYKAYNVSKNKPDESFTYIALMAPVPALVAEAVENAVEGAIINIFAGIPATVTAEIDLDRYIACRLYFIGTSGSTIDDMKCVLAKVESGSLDTNVSVAAVCGLEAAVEGIRAVENRLMAGKIIVYPDCTGLPLTPLEKLGEQLPKVANCLKNGLWSKEAEEELLRAYS